MFLLNLFLIILRGTCFHNVQYLIFYGSVTVEVFSGVKDKSSVTFPICSVIFGPCLSVRYDLFTDTSDSISKYPTVSLSEIMVRLMISYSLW